MKKAALMLIIVLTMSLLAGCGFGKIKTDDGTVKFGKDGIEVVGKDGSTATIGGTSLPKGYPENVFPIMKGAKIEMSSNSTDDGKTGCMVTFTINKGAKSVYDYYYDIVKNAGDLYKQEAEGYYMLTGKLDGWEFGISVTSSDSDSYVQITTVK
jgi:hypothetical protein